MLLSYVLSSILTGGHHDLDARSHAASLRGHDGLRESALRMQEMLDAGGVPSRHVAANFWGVLARYGTLVRDGAMLRRAAAGLRAAFPDDDRMTGWAASLERQAEQVRR